MKKKILFVHYGNDWIRGSEQCLIDLMEQCSDQGFSAHLWTNNSSLHRYALRNNISSEADAFPLLLGWLAPRFDFLGWGYLVRKACKILQRESIDVVHVNSGAPCQWMVLAARIKQVPMVTQLHSPYPARDRLTLGLHLSPHIISVSEYVASQLKSEGYPREHLSVIHNGLHVSKLNEQQTVETKKVLGINDDDFLYATVGSLIHRKGIDRLIVALRHLNFEYPNTHLLVIGDGPLRNELEKHAKKLYLENRVHFVGEQNNAVGWLKGCDAFVSGARSEAFGLVIAEAAVAKIPVVAPFEGGIPEFVQHGETGILYPNSGVGPLSKAMRVLVDNPDFGRQLASNASKHIGTKFNVSLSSHRIIGVYKKIMVSHQPSVSFWRTFIPLKTYLAKRIAMGGQHG
ncbi:glycosyltransferase [Vibrio coralliilyticus]|uniref:glycosyltransferase n=1 Tax=Vibrio coralliilyticus TaxID=190893 RepID=UPI002FD6F1C7